MMRSWLNEKFKDRRHKKGFSLMEMLVVVAIIVILCGIVMVAVFSIGKKMRFKEYNDYAKTIFMAAQANLSSMRNSGELSKLQAEGVNDLPIDEKMRDKVGFPIGQWSDEYVYTSSEFSETTAIYDSYSMVLPVNSVEGHVREQMVIIEYNPITGNVYSVFYSEKDESILKMYQDGELPRDEDSRRELELGYYCGSGLSSMSIDIGDISVTADYVNGEEGYVSLLIPLPEGMQSNYNAFVDSLEVTLNISGKTSNASVSLPIMRRNGSDLAKYKKVNGTDLQIDYILDSLAKGKSFANFAVGDREGTTSLTDTKSESKFSFLPGENLSIRITASYTNGGTAVKLNVDDLPTVNPMFESVRVVDGKNVLTVANGRNLQNLNALTPSIADGIDEVQFSRNIDWNTTVTYYNNEYAEGDTYRNDEAPARALPYFVPIHNELLLGTAKFNGNALDMSSGGSSYAVINGNGKYVKGLNIDSTQYSRPSSNEYYVSAGYTSNGKTVGGKQVVNYSLTGLFTYVNTTVKDLTVVNAKVKGLSFSKAGGNAATGTLAGAAGSNAFFSNCGTYMEAGDLSATSGPKAYKVDASQTWYGVSGEGCVGGLVGYSVSGHVTTGYLTENEGVLAFLRCFSAVPVSGNMRGSKSSGYGYVNGVGGLVGVTKLSNLYACYASGDILASGVYTASKSTNWSIIKLDGTTSMGAGGLVGTSHGSMYSNCFSTGDVESNTTTGTGSFLGVMCYDVAGANQLTLMDSCYTTGKVNGKTGSAFTGGNASVNLGSHLKSTDKIYTDYYLMVAPYYAVVRNLGEIVNNEHVADKYNGHRNLTPITIPANPNEYTIPSRYSDYVNASGTRVDGEKAYQSALSAGTLITYRYLAKDCYYLEQGRSSTTILPRKEHVGTAVCFDTLMDLCASHSGDGTLNGSSAWVKSQWTEIKTWTSEIGLSFEEAYIYLYVHSSLQDHFEGLETFYLTQLAASYKDQVWIDADKNVEGNTYNSGKYIFPMFKDMVYYGDWPTISLTGGLAYFEYYDHDSKIHAQLDRADEGDLLTNDELRTQGAAVISDGYAVASKKKPTKVTVKIGSTAALTFTNFEEWVNPAGETVYLYPLSTTAFTRAGQSVANSATEFYVQAVITLTLKNNANQTYTDSYTVYFNPYAANTQINPVMIDATTHNVPTKPDTLPAVIEIRTARQLGSLATTYMKTKWGQGYNYVQTLDIDGDKYTAGKGYYGANASALANEQRNVWRLFKSQGTYTCTNTAGIGISGTPFSGTYTGIGEGDEKPVITNFFSRRILSIFGPVTENKTDPTQESGKISNLTIRVKDTNWSSNTKACDALLAIENNGTIENVDIELIGDFAMKATTDAGLLVGKSSGLIKDCDITAEKNVTITATTTAGGVTGALTGTVKGGSVEIKGTLSSNAANVGGVAGTADSASIENSTVKLNALTSTTTTANLGGAVGSMNGGKATKVNVVISGTCGGTNFTAIGGMVGIADGVKFQNSSVTVSGKLQAVTAAGLVPTGQNVSVKDCTVTVSGSVEGSTAAAGMVANATGASEFNGNLVVLSNGTVSSSGSAAGFAVSLAGQCTQSKVELAGGTIIGNQAAGFAYAIPGQVSKNCAVTGTGNITGTGKAAGFVVELTGTIAGSRVTPSTAQNTQGYRGGSNDALVINGATAAGFVVNIQNGASVLNCDALGKITGTTISGFADTNNGQIDGCIANVTITAGNAFVRKNSGPVYSSYCWYGDGSATSSTAVPSSGAKFFGCYFVDTDVTDQTKTCVVLFDNKGAYSKIKLSGLAAALDKLNGNVGAKWFAVDTYSTYSYKMSTAYPYPMLREHCGDWAPVA